MLRHLLKLLWKRKSRNLMLSLEILLAFVLVFAVAAAAVRYVQLQRLPTGFAYHDQWMAQIRTDKPIANDGAMYDQLRRSLLELPEVEQVAFAALPVYEMSRRIGDYMRPDGSATQADGFRHGDLVWSKSQCDRSDILTGSPDLAT